jgi:hypothetical protein
MGTKDKKIRQLEKALSHRCECVFEGSQQIWECHWHECFRCGQDTNGDPCDNEQKMPLASGDVPPINTLRALVNELQHQLDAALQKVDGLQVKIAQLCKEAASRTVTIIALEQQLAIRPETIERLRSEYARLQQQYDRLKQAVGEGL